MSWCTRWITTLQGNARAQVVISVRSFVFCQCRRVLFTCVPLLSFRSNYALSWISYRSKSAQRFSMASLYLFFFSVSHFRLNEWFHFVFMCFINLVILHICFPLCQTELNLRKIFGFVFHVDIDQVFKCLCVSVLSVCVLCRFATFHFHFPR